MNLVATDGRLGRVLVDRYRLLSVIGSGGFATVYLANDIQLNRQVAIKVLHAALAHDEVFLDGFTDEAQAAASLSHPNVMQVYDSGTSSEGPFIVMELLSGGSLRTMLDECGVITLSQALQVGFQAAAGLEAAHRANMPHRDMKPGNLLFDDAGRLRVADFGLARARQDTALTEPTGSITGTVRYLAPEAGISALDETADIYSLVMTLVEAVTGTVPLIGSGDMMELLALRRSTPVVLDPRLGSAIPLFEQSLAINPQDRPSARQLAEGIRSAARDCAAPLPLPLVALDLSAETSTMVAFPDAPALETGLVEPEKRKRRWPSVILSLLLLAAVAGGAAYAATQLTEPEIITHLVADQSLRTTAELQAYVDANGWLLQTTEEHHDQVPEGRVISMRPIEGTEIAEGEVVTAVISLGIEQVTLPEMSAQSVEDAQQAMIDNGFIPGDVSTTNDEVAEVGAILEITVGGLPVAAGDIFDKATVVDLLTSVGPVLRLAPDVVGMTPDEATALLEADGLLLNVTGDVFSDTMPAGFILTSSVVSGTEVERGTAIDVTLSKGPDLRTVPVILGETLESATSLLEGVGLKVGTVVKRQDDSNIVFATGTGQEAGTRHSPGTGIDLVLN